MEVVSNEDMIVWDITFLGYWCNLCKRYYPRSLILISFILIFLDKFAGLYNGKTEYVEIVAKTTQKAGLEHHIGSQMHRLSQYLQGYTDKGKERTQPTIDKTFAVTEEDEIFYISGKFRLLYTCIRQHIPFCKYVFIQRACGTMLNSKVMQFVGQAGWEVLRQMLKLISNNIRGHVDHRLILVRYEGLEGDDGSDVSLFSHLCVFERFVWPPPSFAPPSLLPGPPTSYGPEIGEKSVAQCEQCRRFLTNYINCSNHHVMCVDCINSQALFFFSLLFLFVFFSSFFWFFSFFFLSLLLSLLIFFITLLRFHQVFSFN
jgi:hypothetical protein